MNNEIPVLVGLEMDRMIWLVRGLPEHEILDEMLKFAFEGFDRKILSANFNELMVPLKTQLH